MVIGLFTIRMIPRANLLSQSLILCFKRPNVFPHVLQLLSQLTVLLLQTKRERVCVRLKLRDLAVDFINDTIDFELGW